MGRSILVASGKGGSGKTSFTIAMGISLARKGYKVCLVDLNIGLRNIDIYLGLENMVIFDIGDIMSGICKVEKALVRASGYGELYLLEATQNKLIKGLSEGHIKALINQLKKEFDYVIIDSPAAMGNDLTIAAAGSDSAVLILTPDQVSLRNSDAIDKRLRTSGIKSRCFVVNMVKRELDGSDYGPSLDGITKTMEIPMAGMIPYDENVVIGNNAGKPVFAAADSYIARNIDEIVTRMLG